MTSFWRYGLAAGMGNIALYLLLFFLSPKALFHPVLYWGGTLWVLVCMLLAQQAERRRLDAYSFRRALRTGFGVFALATVLFTAFYFLLLNGIDPGLIDLQQQVMQERLDRWGGSKGPQSRDLPEGYTADDLAFTPARALFSLAQNLIGGFLLAAGTAFLMKRE